MPSISVARAGMRSRRARRLGSVIRAGHRAAREAAICPPTPTTSTSRVPASARPVSLATSAAASRSASSTITAVTRPASSGSAAEPAREPTSRASGHQAVGSPATSARATVLRPDPASPQTSTEARVSRTWSSSAASSAFQARRPGLARPARGTGTGRSGLRISARNPPPSTALIVTAAEIPQARSTVRRCSTAPGRVCQPSACRAAWSCGPSSVVAASLPTTRSGPKATSASVLRTEAAWKAASSIRCARPAWSSSLASISAAERSRKGRSSGFASSASPVMSRTPTTRRVSGCRIGVP
ncbi:hypothetical protein [Pseudonocardia sp. WMMC193]|uniref:hypothetical protein n=1 Tax=Pseudonocardia sp. WMMC193 TaxID=2911965 RepID=UPI001F47C6B9|nr:hypothetical protein [Pseudonocardia sp. WMMC193]MCF7550881.1 hypothetical protein [Pseudonocardia sp. WMMC193]